MRSIPYERKSKPKWAAGAEILVNTAASQDLKALDRDRLRLILHPEHIPVSSFCDDGSQGGSLTPASVLFPLVPREGGFYVLLTQRTDHLRDHPGQISFPGGRVEPEDVSPEHTALREAQEEIGLAPEHVEIIGYLPDYCTITGYRVTPVVAIVTPPFELLPDAYEVAEVFEVPLSFLMNPDNHQEHSILRDGQPRRFFAMPYEKYFIWGATAGIIMSLHRALMA